MANLMGVARSLAGRTAVRSEHALDSYRRRHRDCWACPCGLRPFSHLAWVADGHPLIPLRLKHQRIGVDANTTVTVSASAHGYASSPDETIDEKLARVRSALATLDRKILSETRDRERAITQLASAARADWDRESSDRKAEARSDTRVAAAGLCFAASGAVLQLVGSSMV